MHRAIAVVLLLWPHLASADLLDRTRFDYFHMTAATEVGIQHGDAGALTLHVQASTDCGCHFSFYGTLPTSITLRDSPHLIGAGGPVTPDARTVLGTADVGVFGGTDTGGVTTLFRVGALLPTGARGKHSWLPSARAGDRVLELPRSAGVRLSTSRMWDVRHVPLSSLSGRYRVDAGIDVAEVFAAAGDPVHVIPRAGAGLLISYDADLTFSVESALSLDPFVDGTAHVRSGTGITAHYSGWPLLQPAVTLAAVHEADGWGASLLVDLTASSRLGSSNED